MQIRREKWLCFNRDEKFSRNHKYKSKFCILMANNNQCDDNDQNVPIIVDNIEQTLFEEDSYTISYHLLYGHHIP